MAETKTAIKFDAETLAALDELKAIFEARFPVPWTRTSAAKHAIIRLRDEERRDRQRAAQAGALNHNPDLEAVSDQRRGVRRMKRARAK